MLTSIISGMPGPSQRSQLFKCLPQGREHTCIGEHAASFLGKVAIKKWSKKIGEMFLFPQKKVILKMFMFYWTWTSLVFFHKSYIPSISRCWWFLKSPNFWVLRWVLPRSPYQVQKDHQIRRCQWDPTPITRFAASSPPFAAWFLNVATLLITVFSSLFYVASSPLLQSGALWQTLDQLLQKWIAIQLRHRPSKCYLEGFCYRSWTFWRVLSSLFLWKKT